MFKQRMRRSLARAVVITFLVMSLAGSALAEEESLAVADLNKKLREAAREGDVEQVKALIASGADVDSRILDGDHTPLMRAAYRGHYEVMKILIEAGESVSTKERNI